MRTTLARAAVVALLTVGCAAQQPPPPTIQLPYPDPAVAEDAPIPPGAEAEAAAYATFGEWRTFRNGVRVRVTLAKIPAPSGYAKGTQSALRTTVEVDNVTDKTIDGRTFMSGGTFPLDGREWSTYSADDDRKWATLIRPGQQATEVSTSGPQLPNSTEDWTVQPDWPAELEFTVSVREPFFVGGPGPSLTADETIEYLGVPERG